jgi:hypothetical protein
MAIFITLRIDCLSVNSFEPLTFVCERENCTAAGRFYKKYGCYPPPPRVPNYQCKNALNISFDNPEGCSSTIIKIRCFAEMKFFHHYWFYYTLIGFHICYGMIDWMGFNATYSYIVAVWRIENWPILIYPKQVYYTLYLAIFLNRKGEKLPPNWYNCFISLQNVLPFHICTPQYT